MVGIVLVDVVGKTVGSIANQKNRTEVAMKFMHRAFLVALGRQK